MSTKFARVLAVVVGCSSVLFQSAGIGQQGDKMAAKNMASQPKVPEQQTRNELSSRQQLQAQAKKILGDETAREKVDACSDASTTIEFNECFGKQAAITDSSLRALEEVIAELGDPDPEAPDHPAATGIAGPALSPKQHVAEFRKVEQSWRQYRDAACTAAFHQFDGGTGGPSFELECEMRLDRSHMRELEMIYGGDLRL